MRLFFRMSISFLALTFLVSCATGGGVYRDPMEEQILGDKWNNTDANKTAKHMVKSMIEAAWLTNFLKDQGEKPVVIVDLVENRTDEHIDVQALTDAIRSELINSQKVRFVNAKRRQKILDELRYQNESGNVKQSSRTKRGQQTGADYLLGGALSNIVAVKGDDKTVTYQTSLTLTNLETAEIEWNGFHKIKKAFRR